MTPGWIEQLLTESDCAELSSAGSSMSLEDSEPIRCTQPGSSGDPDHLCQDYRQWLHRLEGRRCWEREGTTWLSDILEERAGENRQAEFDVENDEEHAQKAAPDSHLQKLAGIGDDGDGKKKRGRDLD